MKKIFFRKKWKKWEMLGENGKGEEQLVGRWRDGYKSDSRICLIKRCHQTKHESWEKGRVELKPLGAEAEDIRVNNKEY